jgi:hypothetical protein
MKNQRRVLFRFRGAAVWFRRANGWQNILTVPIILLSLVDVRSRCATAQEDYGKKSAALTSLLSEIHVSSEYFLNRSATKKSVGSCSIRNLATMRAIA